MNKLDKIHLKLNKYDKTFNYIFYFDRFNHIFLK